MEEIQNSLIIVSKIHPLAQYADATNLQKYSASLEADVNPITDDVLASDKVGYIALSVITHDGEIYDVTEAVGYAGHAKNREHKGTVYAQIGNLVVLPDFRGKGLAKAMVGKTKNSLISQGYCCLAGVCNHLSSAIFRRYGFVLADEVLSDSGKLKPLYTLHHGEHDANGVK